MDIDIENPYSKRKASTFSLYNFFNVFLAIMWALEKVVIADILKLKVLHLSTAREGCHYSFKYN